MTVETRWQRKCPRWRRGAIWGDGAEMHGATVFVLVVSGSGLITGLLAYRGRSRWKRPHASEACGDVAVDGEALVVVVRRRWRRRKFSATP